MNAPSPTPPLVDPLAQEDALARPDPFDELTPADVIPSTGEEATRPTIRIEAVPSPWRAARRWAGAALAMAVMVGGGRLVDSRRLETNHRLKHPAKRMDTERSRVESVPPGHRHPRPVASPVIRRNRSTLPWRDAISRKSNLAFERGTRSDAGASRPAVSPASAAPPVAPEHVARPREAAESQFSYLGQ
jgi:hypothetical protein